ncbi:MAG TPA: pyridoxal phosphate-dependent aminotransferase [Oculatellaceae cyanobacterium]
MTNLAPKRSITNEKEDTTGIAKRVAQINVSAIKQMPLLAAEIGDCVSLGQGIPSLNTPEFIREAVIEELRSNPQIGKYSLQPGVPALKQAIAEDLKRTKNAHDIDHENNIFISCGGMEALATAISTVVERGDEVILPSPTYASHIEQILFAEGIPKFVPLNEEDGWSLNVDAITCAITEKTKAIILCNPVNPTGATFSEADLRAIASLVLERNLFLIMDEAYDFLVYNNQSYFSLISVPELRNNLIAACSFSKRYCMTGWRVGFMLAPAKIIKQVLKVHDAFAICAPTISQFAALAALRETNGKDGKGDVSMRELIAALSNRRQLVCTRLKNMPEVFEFQKPQGGYYVFPRFKSDLPSVDFALKILREAKVITVPGSAFGPTGEQHIRLSFGAAEEELNEAFDRLEKYFKSKAAL